MRNIQQLTYVEVTAGADVAGTLKLQVAVTEKEILFDTPPGSNGETEFYGVMKNYCLQLPEQLPALFMVVKQNHLTLAGI